MATFRQHCSAFQIMRFTATSHNIQGTMITSTLSNFQRNNLCSVKKVILDLVLVSQMLSYEIMPVTLVMSKG